MTTTYDNDRRYGLWLVRGGKQCQQEQHKAEEAASLRSQARHLVKGETAGSAQAIKRQWTLKRLEAARARVRALERELSKLGQ